MSKAHSATSCSEEGGLESTNAGRGIVLVAKAVGRVVFSAFVTVAVFLAISKSLFPEVESTAVAGATVGAAFGAAVGTATAQLHKHEAHGCDHGGRTADTFAIQRIVSLVVGCVTSLMICLSMAVSPWTISTVALCDDSIDGSDWISSSLTPNLSADQERSQAVAASRCAATNAADRKHWAKDNALVGCLNDVVANVKLIREDGGLFSSFTIANKSLKQLPPGPVSAISFERPIAKAQNHNSLKRKREDSDNSHTGACEDIDLDGDNDDPFGGFVLHSEEASSEEEEDWRPRKKPRLQSPSTDQGFRKRGASVTTRSDPQQAEDVLEGVTKKPRRATPRQQRNCEKHWKTMFQMLCEYQKKHGTTAVPFAFVQDKVKLGRWVSNQRAAHKNAGLLENRVEMLESIDFVWNEDTLEGVTKKPRRATPRQQRNCEKHWKTMFQMLCEYQKKHGTTAVPFAFVQDKVKLGRWVSNQRAAHKKAGLSENRVEMLESIDFVWNKQDRPPRPWMDTYRNLAAYKEEHEGSTVVPRIYPPDRRLGFWVNRQRRRFRAHQLSASEIDLLESIGFVWDPRSETSTDHWMEMYEKLVSYQKEHDGATTIRCGNSKIKTKGNGDLRQLSNWVKEQRRRLRANQLPQKRANLLASIGVGRDGRSEKVTAKWMVMYQKLVCYKKEHGGSTMVPQRYDQDPALGRWVNEQRKRCKKKELVRLLDEIGFVWNARKRNK